MHDTLLMLGYGAQARYSKGFGGVACALCLACSGIHEPVTAGTQIRISPAVTTELRARMALQAAATATDAQGRQIFHFVWMSSDTTIATVDGNGRVYARMVGETTIGAYLPEGESATFTLRVIPTDARLTMASPLLELSAGDTGSVLLTAHDESGRDIDSSLEWASSNPAVATVDTRGLVTANAPGVARVSTHWLNRSAETVVHVPNTPGTGARIRLIFSGVPEWLLAHAHDAARIWESIFLTELPPMRLAIPDGTCNGQNFSPYGLPAIDHVETGLTLFVFVAQTTSVYPRATGGQCVRRFPEYTTLFGVVALSSMAIAVEGDTYPWMDVLVHEMGHTLGLVGNFSQYGFNDPPFVVGRAARSGTGFHWTGEFARIGRQLETGLPITAVPVGFDGHWAFRGDIMGNRAGEPVAITPTSIGALLDIGYPTAMSRAGIGPLCYGTTCR